MILVVHYLQPYCSQVVNYVLMTFLINIVLLSFLCMYSHIKQDSNSFVITSDQLYKTNFFSLGPLLFHPHVYISQNVWQGIVYIQCPLGLYNYERPNF